MMYAKMKTDSVSVLIIDHPKNIGYPTYWHARGYGLFAANPLGDKVFTNGKAERNLSLKAGESITFRYRVAVAAGKTALPQTGITQLQNDFAAKPVKLMYVGSYTGKGNPGIQVYAFDQTTGKSSLVREHRNPSAGYFAITPDKKYIYSLGEEGNRKGSVWAYSIDQKTGELIKLNSQPTVGDGPCYISFDPKTRTIYCANYSGGSLTVFKTAENGSLLPAVQHVVYNGSSVNKSRQDKAHAHCAVIAPGGKYLYVNDLGADRIYRHTIKADGSIEETPLIYATAPGDGPRHIVFNTAGSRAYSINEMKGSVDAFVVEAAGLKKIQTIVADTVQTKNDHGSGAIHLSPDGRWLIASNRITSNQVVVYKVLADGKLEKKNHTEVVKKPRFFRFDETGKFVLVAGQDGDRVQVFAFDGKTGTLKNTGNDIEVFTPVAIEFY
jgi:6-phosphogluconolactonase (cycloisomerase 2 family)